MTSRRDLTSANINSCNLRSNLVSSHDDRGMMSEVEEAVDARFQQKEALTNDCLKKEFSIAHQILTQTGKLPMTIDSNCLSCMAGGRDTQLILRMFKTACISYQPSSVAYREHTISRTALIGMRRDLIDKIVNTM